MIDINSIGIVVNPSLSGVDEIIRNVKVIISTPKGTVPLDRDFGIDMSFLDAPNEISKGLFTVQVIESIRKYESRIDVKEVSFTQDFEKIIPRIILE